jgi:hypothetical protein
VGAGGVGAAIFLPEFCLGNIRNTGRREGHEVIAGELAAEWNRDVKMRWLFRRNAENVLRMAGACFRQSDLTFCVLDSV